MGKMNINFKEDENVRIDISVPNGKKVKISAGDISFIDDNGNVKPIQEEKKESMRFQYVTQFERTVEWLSYISLIHLIDDVEIDGVTYKEIKTEINHRVIKFRFEYDNFTLVDIVEEEDPKLFTIPKNQDAVMDSVEGILNRYHTMFVKDLPDIVREGIAKEYGIDSDSEIPVLLDTVEQKLYILTDAGECPIPPKEDVELPIEFHTFQSDRVKDIAQTIYEAMRHNLKFDNPTEAEEED